MLCLNLCLPAIQIKKHAPQKFYLKHLLEKFSAIDIKFIKAAVYPINSLMVYMPHLPDALRLLWPFGRFFSCCTRCAVCFDLYFVTALTLAQLTTCVFSQGKLLLYYQYLLNFDCVLVFLPFCQAPPSVTRRSCRAAGCDTWVPFGGDSSWRAGSLSPGNMD